MNSVGELRKQSHNLKSIERVRLGSGFELVGFCECDHVSSGGDGPLPQVHREILARHKAHVAEVAACTHPDAATVEEPRLGLLGWVCPDCGDEFRFPDTMEGMSAEMAADMQALERNGSLPGLEHLATPRAGEIRKRVQFSPEVKKAVWVRDGGRCRHCGISDNEAMRRYGDHLHYDHVVPFSRGGSDSEQNCQLLCRGCDLAKGNRFAG